MNFETLKKIIKPIILLILIDIVVLNYYSSFIKKDPYTLAKYDLFSLNSGQSYFGSLSLWRLLAQNNDWERAQVLESKIDKVDINDYKVSHQPQELKKSLSLLTKKINKTADDWIEIARIQSILGNIEESKIATQKAYQADPIRDDISKLYYQLQIN
ncbi:MAG: hypothetical protein WCG91_01450 [Candidatus Shapirobacteria bacterium]